MANIPLKTVKFLGLPDTYTIPQIDDTLSQVGKAADAKAVGDAVDNAVDVIAELQDGLNGIDEYAEFINPKENIIDFSSLTNGYINGQGSIGNQSAQSLEKTSPIIEIDSDNLFLFKNIIPAGKGTAWLAVGLWDINEAWLGRVNATVTSDGTNSVATLELNKNIASYFYRAKYIRVSWRTFGLNSENVTEGYNITDEGKTITAVIADKLNSPLTNSYQGNNIDFGYNGLDTKRMSFNPPAESGSTKTLNGLAIHDGIIFQGYSDGSVSLIDMENGELIITHQMNAGHASSLSFSNEFPSDNTDFPYLYIESYDEPKVFVFSVTRSAFTLVKTYCFDTSVSGYYQQACINKFDNKLWVVGHKVNSFTYGQKLIWTCWDLTATVDNGDSTETPTMVETFETPYIQYIQCIQILNNQIFIGSGADSINYPTAITVLNPYAKSYMSIMKYFPTTVLSSEIEGFDFVLNSEIRKYYMVVGMRKSLSYYKFVF